MRANILALIPGIDAAHAGAQDARRRSDSGRAGLRHRDRSPAACLQH
jgi:hypothetical protein